MRLASRAVTGALLVAAVAAGAGCDRFGDAGKAALAQQAKITPDQARTAALGAMPGAVRAVRFPRADKEAAMKEAIIGAALALLMGAVWTGPVIATWRASGPTPVPVAARVAPETARTRAGAR